MADEKKEENKEIEQTLGLIKPDSFYRSDEIINRIISEGFTVLDKKQVNLTRQRASEFYGEHKGKGFYDELVNFMCSGPIYALKLEKSNAIKSWRTLMGPTKYEQAKKESPNCLRALFASNTTKNACHGSDSIESAKRELDFYFNTQQTLALIKPDAVSAGKVDEIIKRIQDEQFLIIEKQKIQLTKERAEAFYAEHKGRGFFGELVQFMCSGPIIALKLEKKDGIRAWRDLMGPTNFETAKKESPNSLRALYGSSMTKNATHGSDSITSAVRELNFYFQQEATLALLKPDAVLSNKAEEIINRIAGAEEFNILEFNKLKLEKDRAESFYIEHKGKGFFNELINFMCSGEIYALKLQSTNGIKKWRDLMGPTNFETAKKESPNSIRALYGSSMTKNASHGSDSIDSAKRELEFYFNSKNNEPRSIKEYTLAMIKPDVTSECKDDNNDMNKVNQIINRIKYEGFMIVNMVKMKLTKDKAEAFYGEHKGKGFFNELIDFMCSGDVIAMKLEKENAIKEWRNVMGPTNFETAKKEAPDSIRALYGSTMTKNASHGSDSVQSAKRELDFFFK
eukprot:429143_1